MPALPPVLALTVAEPVSSATHLLGAALFLALTVWLLRRHGDSPARVTALLVFGVASVFLLSMSGVYHLLPVGGAARPILRQLDHSAIFVLISGTLTAVHLILFTGRWRWVMLAVAWTICTLGVVLKAVYFEQTPEWLGLGIYLLMGSLGLISTVQLWRLEGRRFVALLLAGGLTYTFGAVLEYLRVPVLLPGVVGPHEIFHLAVLAALGLHWGFVHHALVAQGGSAGVGEGGETLQG